MVTRPYNDGRRSEVTVLLNVKLNRLALSFNLAAVYSHEPLLIFKERPLNVV
jgi:hypothetical protein